MEKTSFFTISGKDAINAAVNAVVAGVVIGLAGVVTKEGFDVFTVQWSGVLHQMINWAFAAFVGSLGKSLLTTKQGNVLGMIAVK